jgi:hypothetical protein
MEIEVEPLSAEMAAAVLHLLQNTSIPFAAAEKVLEIRAALEAITHGKHIVVFNQSDSQNGDSTESPESSP